MKTFHICRHFDNGLHFKEVQYVGRATNRGARIMARYFGDAYHFSTKTGDGVGRAKDWRIAPNELPKVRQWAKLGT
jgi:hypothetical protein